MADSKNKHGSYYFMKPFFLYCIYVEVITKNVNITSNLYNIFRAVTRGITQVPGMTKA